MKTIIKLISSCCYLGYVPFASGTVGSLVGLLIYFTIQSFVGIYTLVVLLVMILGFLVSKEAELIFGCKDSPKIIIDEVAGMLITLYAVPLKFEFILVGFFLFRILDIFKPYPARQLEKVPNGRGVMLDDMVCGIYANLVLQVVLRLPA